MNYCVEVERWWCRSDEGKVRGTSIEGYAHTQLVQVSIDSTFVVQLEPGEQKDSGPVPGRRVLQPFFDGRFVNSVCQLRQGASAGTLVLVVPRRLGSGSV